MGFDSSAAMLQKESGVSPHGFTIPHEESYSEEAAATRKGGGPCTMDAKIGDLFRFEISNGYMERELFGT